MAEQRIQRVHQLRRETLRMDTGRVGAGGIEPAAEQVADATEIRRKRSQRCSATV